MKVHSSIAKLEDFVPTGNLADPKTEARVIAALMGNFSVAFPQVDGLAVDDFYSEQWRVIYKAIKVLAANGTPIDTTSVEHALRKMGKYEVAGGDTVVATVGLQYDENIIHHCDLLVALSLRRQTIARLQQYISEAESETVNMTALLNEAAKDIAQFAATATPRSHEIKMQELATQLSVVDRPPTIAPLVFIDQTPVVRRGDHSLIVGKEKSRKSLFLTHLITDYLRNNPSCGSRVKIFDTEQDRDDVWLSRDRIRKTTGITPEFFNMRGMSPKQRRDFISWTVQSGVDFIIIDGVRDCMTNFIDVQETTEIIVWLEDMTVRHNLAIVNVLHLNKSDGNARGHIGTELQNKALCTIEISYDEKTTLSNVKCRSARKKSFEPFAFRHSMDGNYEYMGTISAPQAGEDPMPKSDKQRRIEAIFEDQIIPYKTAVDGIMAQFKVGARRAQQLLAEYTRDGICIKNGKPGDKNVVYKLSTSAFLTPLGVNYNGNGHHPVVPEPQPAPLFEQNGHDKYIPTEDLPF